MTVPDALLPVPTQRHHSPATRPVSSGRTFNVQPFFFGLALAGLLVGPPAVLAQTGKLQVPASAAENGKTGASGPSWSELNASQRQALAPLASSWNTTMSEAQKRKWLEISKNFSALPPEGQAMLNSRMNDWVSLSPQQRAQARLNFGQTKELSKQLTPEEKKAKWEAYQALSPEEKKKLAAKGIPTPTGAATAVKPVAPQKLATVPANPASRPAPRIIPSPPAPAAASFATPPVGQAAPVGN